MADSSPGAEKAHQMNPKYFLMRESKVVFKNHRDTLEKPGQHLLIKWSKLKSPAGKKKKKRKHMPSNIQNKNEYIKTTLILLGYSCQRWIIWSIEKEPSSKSKLRNIAQNKCLPIFKNIKIMRVKEKVKKCSRFEQNKKKSTECNTWFWTRIFHCKG